MQARRWSYRDRKVGLHVSRLGIEDWVCIFPATAGPAVPPYPRALREFSLFVHRSTSDPQHLAAVTYFEDTP